MKNTTASPKTIQLISSNSELADRMEVIAGQVGYQIVWFDALEAALQDLEHYFYAAVIFDIPPDYAYTLTAIQQILVRAPGSAVIALADDDDEKSIKDAIYAGAHDHLSKEELKAALFARTLRYAIDRKTARDSLRESQRAFLTLVNNLPGMVFRCQNDHKWTLELVSAGCHALTGYYADELIKGRRVNYGDLIFPEDREKIWSEIQVSLNHRTPYVITYRLIAANGDIKTVWEQGEGVYDPEDNLQAIEGYITDISHQRRIREALNESLQKFRALVESFDDIVYTLDLNQRFTGIYGHRAFNAGFNPEWSLGCTAQEVLPQHAALMHEIANQNALEGKHQIFEWSQSTALGQLYFQTSISPLFNESHQVVGLVGVGRDITSIKKHEQEQEAIITLASAMRTATNRAQMLDVIQDELQRLLSASGLAIALWEECAQGFIVERATGMIRANSGQPLMLRTGSLGMTALREGLPQSSSPAMQIGDIVQASQLKENENLIAVPLLVQDNKIGIIWLLREAPFSKHEIQLMNTFGNMVANALHRATLFEQTEKRLCQLRSLREVDQAVISKRNLPEVMQVIVEQINANLVADAVEISIVDPDTGRTSRLAAMGFSSPYENQEPLRVDKPIRHCALFSGKIEILTDSHDTVEFFLQRGVAFEGFTGYVSVPIFVDNSVQGVIEVFSRAGLKVTNDILEYLEILAGQAALAIDNINLYESLKQTNAELIDAYDSTIEGWSRTLDMRDKETEGHTQRVTFLTLELATRMGCKEDDLIQIRRGALLHDIGKMGIPDDILHKPGPLDDREWALMKLHPEYAYERLKCIRFLSKALEIPYCHHEKWDGTGYPRGLMGLKIPLSARIFSVIDVWDALTSDRPYRKAWSSDQALEYIREQSGRHFDPQVVSEFLKMAEEGLLFTVPSASTPCPS